MSQQTTEHGGVPLDHEAGNRSQTVSPKTNRMLLLQQTIDAMSDSVLILNGRREIVRANRHLLQKLESKPQDVAGLRLGAAMGCVNAKGDSDRCGTSEGCKVCGAMDVILDAHDPGQPVTHPCPMFIKDPVPSQLDFAASATPVDVDGERFTILVLRDVTDERRLAALATLLSHDSSHEQAGSETLSELLDRCTPADDDEALSSVDLSLVTDLLIDEVEAERDWELVESGELKPSVKPVNTLALLRGIQATFAQHPMAKGRTLEFHEIWGGNLLTDRRLMGHVLRSMLANAFEATEVGGTVTVSCEELGKSVLFSVHNAGEMSESVQSQLFQRDFTTKPEPGRGLGTFCMKRLGETYLGGVVDFSTSEAAGTVFRLTLPKVLTPRSWK
jgi:hypothetical protein